MQAPSHRNITRWSSGGEDFRVTASDTAGVTSNIGGGMQKGITLARGILSLMIVVSGAAIAIPLGRYAERDDAPGGVLIAFLIFIGASLLSAWILKRHSS